jgi:hypothetical protein
MQLEILIGNTTALNVDNLTAYNFWKDPKKNCLINYSFKDWVGAGDDNIHISNTTDMIIYAMI